MILGGDSYRVLREFDGDGSGTGSLDVVTTPTSAQDGVLGQISREMDAINEWDVDLGDGVGGDHHDSGVPAEQRKPKVAAPKGMTQDQLKAAQEQFAREQAKQAALQAKLAENKKAAEAAAGVGTGSMGEQRTRTEMDLASALPTAKGGRPLEEQLPDKLEREFELGAEKARKLRAAELQEAALANVRAAEATETYYAEVAKQRLDTAAVFEGEADNIGELKEKALSESLMQAQRVQDVARKVGAFAPRPGRLFSDASGAASFGAALALAAGAMESSRSGGPNVALGIIDNAIKRDVAAQELELEGMKAELQAEATVFQEIRAAYGDALAAQKAQSAAEKEAAVMYLRSQMDRYQGPVQKQQMMAVAHQIQASSNNDLIAMTKRMYRTVTRHKKGQVMDDLKRGDLKGPWLDRDMSLDELQKSLKERAEEERIGAASAEEEGEAKALGKLRQAEREAQEAETLQTPPPEPAPAPGVAPGEAAAPAPKRIRKTRRPPPEAAPPEAPPTEQPSVGDPAQLTPDPMPEVPVFSEEKQARLAELDPTVGGEPLTAEEEQERDALLAEKEAIEAQQELAEDAVEREVQAQAQRVEDYEAQQRDSAEVARQDAEAQAQREASEAQREASEAQRQRDAAATVELKDSGVLGDADQVNATPRNRTAQRDLALSVSRLGPERTSRLAFQSLGGYPGSILTSNRLTSGSDASRLNYAANTARMASYYGSYAGVPKGRNDVRWISYVGDSNFAPGWGRNPNQDSAKMLGARGLPTMAMAPGGDNSRAAAEAFGRQVAGGDGKTGKGQWLPGAVQNTEAIMVPMDLGGGRTIEVPVRTNTAVGVFYNAAAYSHTGNMPEVKTGQAQQSGAPMGTNPYNPDQKLYWREGVSKDAKKAAKELIGNADKLIDGSYAVQLYDAMYEANAASGFEERLYSALELTKPQFEEALAIMKREKVPQAKIRKAMEMLGMLNEKGEPSWSSGGTITGTLNAVKTLAGSVSHFEGFKTPQRAELRLSEQALGATALSSEETGWIFDGGFRKWLSQGGGARTLAAKAYRARVRGATDTLMQSLTEPELSYEMLAKATARKMRQGAQKAQE